MKNGSTHLAHKAEHAVDLETGAVVAVTIQHADQGDTATMVQTIAAAGENIAETALNFNSPKQGEQVNPTGPDIVVGDKGYHSNDALVELNQAGVRSYISEPDRGRRKWIAKQEEQKAVYGNRRRIKSEYGKALLKQSGGKVLKRKTRKVKSRLATALRVAATTLKKSDSYLGAQYRRFRTKLGEPKAITAMAAKLARLIYRMLRYGQEYVDKGTAFYEAKYKEQQIKLLVKKAAQHGFALIPVSNQD